MICLFPAHGNKGDQQTCAGEVGHTYVEAACALWKFDIKQQAWQHQHSTGCIPNPAWCCGMAIVGDQAFVMVQHDCADSETQADDTEPAADERMSMYVLNLETWHWTQLPPHSAAPLQATCPSPAVVQVGY